MGNYELDRDELMSETQRLRDTAGGGKGGNFLDNFVHMPEGNGTVVVRILPRERMPFVANRIHRINDRSVHCRKELVGGRWVGNCPVCDYYNWLWATSDKLAKQNQNEESEKRKAEARAIKPMERFYYNAIVRKEQKPNGDVEENVGPKILSVGKGLHQRIMRAMTGDESMDEQPLGGDTGMVLDLKRGNDLKIIKRVKGGPGNFPDYDESKFLDSSPAGDPDKCVKWMENVHDLSKLRDAKSIEELNYEVDVYRGVITDDRYKSRFDDTPAPRPTLEAVVNHDPASDDSPPTRRYEAPAAEVTSTESAPLSNEDFMKRLKDL